MDPFAFTYDSSKRFVRRKILQFIEKKAEKVYYCIVCYVFLSG